MLLRIIDLEEQALYYRLGEENLKLLVEKFYVRVFADERINHLFKNDINTIKSKQLLFLTQFLGGPDLYSQIHGHPRMRARHLPHAITEDAAVAWLQNMLSSIEELPIADEMKEELFDRFPQTAFFMVNTRPEENADESKH